MGVINHRGIPFKVAAPQDEGDGRSRRLRAFEESNKIIDIEADEELGIENMQDVVDLVKKVRRERRSERAKQ
jgi:antitoxin component of RelBE/YafQ-DinJ toxin-antitoxin module